MFTVFRSSPSAEQYATKFPEGFMWGTSSSAYQIEGATDEGGRGETVWDEYCKVPGNCAATADVADDHYHRWKEDVAMMKEMGLPYYRLSFAWSRLMPTGRSPVNQEGVNFYNK